MALDTKTAVEVKAREKDLLTKHLNVVSEYLSAHYDEFFDLYEKLLMSSNYVPRRQSLKLLSEFLLEPLNSHSMKRYILEVRFLKVMMTLLKIFVANPPNKPPEVNVILAKSNEKLLELLSDLSVVKDADDEEYEEERN